MKKHLLWIVAAGLSLSAECAQAQLFRPGVLVPAKGDTLRGEIEDNSWEEAPEQVRFRPAAGAAITTYAPTEVRRFSLQNGRHFRYEQLPFDRMAQIQLDRLPTGLVTQQQNEQFLAEVLVEGNEAELLHTSLDGAQHYFVRRPGQPFIELAARQYYTYRNGRLMVMDGNNYHSQLLLYFGDCPAAEQAAQKAAFTRHDLMAVVQAYNQQCSATRQPGATHLTSVATRSVGLNVGIVGGGRYVSSRLTTEQAAGVEAPVLDGINLDGKLHPVGGVYLDLLTPGRRFALHLAGLLSTYGRQGSAPAVGGQVGYFNTRETLVEARLGMRYFWPVGKQGVQVLAGTGLTLLFDQTQATSTSAMLYYPGSRSVPGVSYLATADYLPSAYPSGGSYLGGLLPGLPYLEAGVRQGRLTVLLEGRLGPSYEYATNITVRKIIVAGSGYYEGYTYNCRNWYVGTTLGVSLLHRR